MKSNGKHEYSALNVIPKQNNYNIHALYKFHYAEYHIEIKRKKIFRLVVEMNYSKKVWFVRDLAPSTTIYQVLGLQYFSIETLPRYHNGKKSLKYKILLPGALMFVAIQNIAVVFISIYKTKHTDENFLREINMLLAVLRTVIVSALLILTFVTTEKQQEIYRNYEEISELAFRNLLDRINLKNFSRNFRRKRFMILLSQITLVGVYVFIISKISKINLIISVLFSYSGIFFCATPTKVMMFFDLLNFHLKFLQKTLKALVKSNASNYGSAGLIFVKPIRSGDLFHKLHTIKRIYSLIYKNSQLTNDCCGWIVMKFMVLMLVIITASVFGILERLHRGTDLEQLVGGYSSIRFLLLVFSYDNC